MNEQQNAQQAEPEERVYDVTFGTQHTPNRRQRRAAATKERLFRKRAVTHQCVLDRDIRAAGISILIDDPVEYHKFHTARGESSCPACPVCVRFKAMGRPPMKFTEQEQKILLDMWHGAIAQHQKIHEQAPHVVPALEGFFRAFHGVTEQAS